jgi:putative DNA primase/helicase
MTGMPLPNVICFNGFMVDVLKDANRRIKNPQAKPLKIEMSEDFWSLDHVNYDYVNEYEGKMPIFQKFLDETLGFEEQTALQEMFGVCVSDETRYEKFWFLHGEGATGKGVTTEILEALVGRDNVCNVLIENLNEDFKVHPITECKVNIMGDMQTFSYGKLAGIEGILTQITGKGGSINVNKKYEVMKKNVAIRARFIFTTNILPGFVDKTEGIWRRMVIIPYPEVSIPQDRRDANLSEKIIKKELPYIMAWAIDGLANVLKRGYPFESVQGEKQKRKLQSACNHEQEFLKDTRIVAGDGKKGVKELYEEYKDWMRDGCYKPLSAGNFVNNICKISKCKVEYTEFLGSKMKCFVGLRDETELDLD